MIRTLFSIAVLLVAAAACSAADKPNVVLIVADDLGWADLGCYGSTYHRTPTLDALARRGVRFTQAYAAAPVCSPSRAAVVTGKYPPRVGITDWIPGQPDRPAHRLRCGATRNELALEEVTVAEELKRAGYATAHVGKWHLGGDGFTPDRQGFDRNVGGDNAGHPPSYFAPYADKTRTLRGLEHAPAGEYLTDRLTREAVGFIAANRARPFFLYLPHYAVHTPLQAKREVIAKYKPGRPGTQGNPTYAAMVESLDESVGAVLRALDENQVADRTVVVFTSDNGGLATLEGMPQAPTVNTPLRDGKGYLYEGGIRVPLVVRAPGVTKPAVSAVPVCGIDLLPTVLDLCGVSGSGKVDGVSFKPVLTGGGLPARDLFWHYPHYANQGGRPGGAVRSGDYKLVEFYETGRHELFDLKADGGEGRNLAAEKPGLVRDLAAKLDRWRADVGAKTPAPNPAYRPNPPAKDGAITLHARTALVTGTQLRYEPLPHKDTLGYWTRADDTATFDFTTERAGAYAVDVLQGCGRGSGGSEVEVSVGASRLTFAVKDTGGFQAFEARRVGTLAVPGPGRHTLTVRPLSKPGPAVMDLRQIVLTPVE